MLRIEHVIPYLGTKLNVSNGVSHNFVLFGIKNNTLWVEIDRSAKNSNISKYQLPLNLYEAKLVVRQLEDLVKEIPNQKGLLFVQEIDKDLRQITNVNTLRDMASNIIRRAKSNTLYFAEAQMLCKHHFDIFGLQEKGFAVNMTHL
jgi:hypothetical protein